jgi:hypothetical protein
MRVRAQRDAVDQAVLILPLLADRIAGVIPNLQPESAGGDSVSVRAPGNAQGRRADLREIAAAA